MTKPRVPLTDQRFQYTPSHQTDLAKKWDRLYPGWRRAPRAPRLAPTIFGVMKEVK